MVRVTTNLHHLILRFLVENVEVRKNALFHDEIQHKYQFILDVKLNKYDKGAIDVFTNNR